MRFDPEVISYEALLAWFWQLHDPTTLNRQGNDVGTQYRSVVFTHSEDQERVARRALEALDAAGEYAAPVITEIAPAGPFYVAEDYHQQYMEKRGRRGGRLF